MRGGRHFGLGVTLLHSAEDADEAKRQARERRIQQQKHKMEMDAAESYKSRGSGGGGRLGGAFERRRRQRSATDLPSTSDKIGSAPAPFFNAKKQKWFVWKEEEVAKRRERNALWSSLGGGAKKKALDASTKLDPITHQPLTKFPGRPRRGQNGGVGAPRESINYYQKYPGLVNRLHGQQGLQFVPSTTQVLKPFNVEDLAHGAFTNRNARENISIPISPLRRSTYKGRTQHAEEKRWYESTSPARYGGGIYMDHRSDANGRGEIGRTDLYSNNKRSKPARKSMGLVSMDDMRRRQFHEALLVEKGRNGDNLYESDVRRICNLFFVPSNSVNTALRNAMSVLSNLGDNKVNVNVFMRRLFGDAFDQDRSAPDYARRSSDPHTRKSSTRIQGGAPFGIEYPSRQPAAAFGYYNPGFPSTSPIRDYTESFQDGTPQVPPHLESQRKLVFGRRRLQRRGGPRVTKSWFLPDEDLVKAPYPTHLSYSSPNLKKTSGTQTEIDGEYGSSRSIMESIVRNHEKFQSLDSKSASPIGSELTGDGHPVNFLRASGLAMAEAMDPVGVDFANSSVLDPLDSFIAHDQTKLDRPLILMEGLEATINEDDKRIEKQNMDNDQDKSSLLEQLMQGARSNQIQKAGTKDGSN